MYVFLGTRIIITIYTYCDFKLVIEIYFPSLFSFPLFSDYQIVKTANIKAVNSEGHLYYNMIGS
jgi:hypothetical protein